VLIVDDEVDLLEVAVTYLAEMGFTVLSAVDGPSALEVSARTPAVDLLLTDVVMPGGMNGVILAQQIRQQHPEVKVIYASGFPSSTLVERRQLHVDGPLINKIGKSNSPRRCSRRSHAVATQPRRPYVHETCEAKVTERLARLPAPSI
jgi:CheY-like chemotaxis protein